MSLHLYVCQMDTTAWQGLVIAGVFELSSGMEKGVAKVQLTTDDFSEALHVQYRPAAS